MVVVSYSGKEINAKLVYYGAGLSGKTTNLESIYEAVPDTSRGKMVSMKTQSDRTLFFDLLPLDLGEIMGFKTRFLLYTVPGQVFYNATRKLVLKGADAIVFVADSEVGKMEENKESLANLHANLAEYDLKLDEIPWVIQYNKRDLPNVYSVEELNRELNPGAVVPAFEAVATQGRGVFETFRGISHLLMEKVTRELRRAPLSGSRTKPSRTDQAVNAPSQATPTPEIFEVPRREPAPVAAESIVEPRPVAASDRSQLGTLGGSEESGVTVGPASYHYGRELSLGSHANVKTDDSIEVAHPGDGPKIHSEDPALAAIRPITVAASATTAVQPPRGGSGDLARESMLDLETTGLSTPQRPGMVVTSAAAPAAAPAAPARAGETELVVPVAIPRGTSREIVLRIIITEGN